MKCCPIINNTTHLATTFFYRETILTSSTVIKILIASITLVCFILIVNKISIDVSLFIFYCMQIDPNIFSRK